MYLVEGRTYTFRVESRNALGYSIYSAELPILAAQIPGTPSAPTTTNIGKSIRIDWSPPDDGGTSITSYTIHVRNVDGVEFNEDLVNCDGTDPQIIADRACLIPNKVLNQAPSNLLWGDEVYAILEVSNVYGTSPASAAGNGAILVNGPSIPLNFMEDRSLTTGYTIGLQWIEGTDNGGTPVLDYAVWGDQATGVWIQLDQKVLSSPYTAINLVSGTLYKFKVVGRNAHDYGDFTQEL
jgi:hypothetical protein